MGDPATNGAYPAPSAVIGGIGEQSPAAVVPCLICGAAVPAITFVDWSPERDIVFAECPHCHRQVFIPTEMWSHFSQLPHLRHSSIENDRTRS